MTDESGGERFFFNQMVCFRAKHAQARGQCGTGVDAGIGAVIDGAVGAVTGGVGKVAGFAVGVGAFSVSYL